MVRLNVYVRRRRLILSLFVIGYSQCVYMGQVDRIKPYTDFATRTDRFNYLNVHGL